jgi:hypothetical protein
MRRSEKIARLRMQREDDVEIVIILAGGPIRQSSYSSPTQAAEDARRPSEKDQ